jgi:putative oxygen-independent coproporphyrinogen III oxidase
MTRRTIPIVPIATHSGAVADGVSPAPTGGSGLLAPPPLALYVHWPWCVKKCPYCDFNSHEVKGEIDQAAYLAAMISDLESALPAIWGRSIISIFIGGGTPSLMSGETCEALLAAIRMRLPLQPDAEITLEANPGTAEAEKFAAFRAAGVNRLSIGIQSFDDEKLRALGRIHDSAEARRAIELGMRHFDRVNIDLMYALPDQSLAQAQSDINTGIASGVSHLSAYHLTMEPNTPFHHNPPPMPDDDLAADMQDMVESQMAAAGFEHYETSAFAKPGQRCRHNLNYWTFGDYLGIGAGAHSKLSNHEMLWREARHRHPRAYVDQVAANNAKSTHQVISRADLPGEFMMNALRLNDGVNTRLFSERTGIPSSEIHQLVLATRREGLLDADRDLLRPSAMGRRYLNRLIGKFL